MLEAIHARVAPATTRLGVVLLRSVLLRSLLNPASERLGASFNAVFIGCFGGCTPARPFVWKARFLDAAFEIPVLAGERRSWVDAWAWRWSGNASLRRFYELYLETATPGTFVDVGANDGLHTYPFAAHGFRCVCLEPQPANCEYIRRTAALNRFAAVDVREVAAGADEAGAVPFYVSGWTMFSSRERAQVERYEPAERIDVPATTLDAVCAELAPDVVKIDVEGWEWEVLRGAEATLARCRPTLVVELASDPELRQRCWELAARHGYRLYFLERGPAVRRIESLAEFVDAGAARENANFAWVQDGALAASLDARA